jgi:Zn-dependent protease
MSPPTPPPAPSPYHHPQLPPVAPPKPWWKKAFGPAAAIGLLILKFGGKIALLLKAVGLGKVLLLGKYLPVLLKTGGTMILSIGVYAFMFGWPWAVGFIALIFVHEMGHVWAAKWQKLDVSAPVFIPFFGAQILLRQNPQNAWVEAIVGIGGPILGTLGAVACQAVYDINHQPLWLSLAYTGYFLNLFNLVPITPLDGGRICAALSPYLWLVGLPILIWMLVQQPFSPVIIFILFCSLPQVWQLFSPRNAEQQRYYEVPPAKRWIVGTAYFSLLGLLFYIQHQSWDQLQSLRLR